MIIEYLTVVLLFILCGICTYTDLSEGYVYNKILISIGGPAIVCNLMSHQKNEAFDMKNYIIWIGIALVLSLVLYFGKIWAGGDCKLYGTIVLATPYNIVAKTAFHLSYLIFILILAFSIGYLYLIVESLMEQRKDTASIKQTIQKTGRSTVRYFKYYFAVAFFHHMLNDGLNIIDITIENAWILILLNIAFIFILDRYKILEYRSVIMALFVANLVICSFRFDAIINRENLLMWAVIIVSFALRNMTENYNYKEIPIHQLQAGMILSMGSSMTIANDRISGFKKISDESLNSRLSKDEVIEIKTLAAKRTRKLAKVYIVKKIPFAVFIVIATLIVLLGGNYFEFVGL